MHSAFGWVWLAVVLVLVTRGAWFGTRYGMRYGMRYGLRYGTLWGARTGSGLEDGPRRSRKRRSGHSGQLERELELRLDEIDQLQSRVTELENRLDFAERLLTQRRELLDSPAEPARSQPAAMP